MVRRFAACSCLAEQIEARVAAGEQVDLTEHCQLASTPDEAGLAHSHRSRRPRRDANAGSILGRQSGGGCRVTAPQPIALSDAQLSEVRAENVSCLMAKSDASDVDVRDPIHAVLVRINGGAS